MLGGEDSGASGLALVQQQIATLSFTIVAYLFIVAGLLHTVDQMYAEQAFLPHHNPIT